MKSRLELLNEMLAKEPADPFLNYAMALEFHKNGEKQKAIALLENVIRVDENYLAAYYQLGKFYEDAFEKNKAFVYTRCSVVNHFYYPAHTSRLRHSF